MVAVNQLLWAHTGCEQSVLLHWFPITNCWRNKVGQIQLCYLVSTLIWSGWIWKSSGSPLGLTSNKNSFCLARHWHFLFSVIWELVVVSKAEVLTLLTPITPLGSLGRPPEGDVLEQPWTACLSWTACSLKNLLPTSMHFCPYKLRG